jgi:hypothetical protein
VDDVGGLNRMTTPTYDATGRENKVVGPDGVATATVYGADGNVCRTIVNATIDPTTLANPCSDPIAAKTATANLDTLGIANEEGRIDSYGQVKLNRFSSVSSNATMNRLFSSASPVEDSPARSFPAV